MNILKCSLVEHFLKAYFIMLLNSAYTYEYFVIPEAEFILIAKQIEHTFIIYLSLNVSFPLFFRITLGYRKYP